MSAPPGHTAPDYRAFPRGWQLAGTDLPANWIAQLTAVAAGVRRNGRRRRIAVTVAILAFIGAIVLLCIGAVAASGAARALITAAGGGGIVAAIAAAIVAIAASPTVVPPLLDGGVLPLLAVLREELVPGQAVSLTLDLGDPAQGRNASGAPRTFDISRGKVTEQHYVNGWLAGATVLLDGTRLRWQFADQIRRRTKRARNARGKTKTKIKDTTKRRLVVRLALPRKHYRAVAPPAEPRRDRKVVVRAGAKRDLVTLRRTIALPRPGLRQQAGAPPAGLSPAEQFLGLVQEAYAQARPGGTTPAAPPQGERR